MKQLKLNDHLYKSNLKSATNHALVVLSQTFTKGRQVITKIIWLI